ncbi:MAG TPA: glycosyltransferase family 1 protein [Anaerolineales bacterium]|jgi:glycosyltransferase involved in cell wall biosynthesis
MKPIVNGRFLARQVSGVERYGREVLTALGDRLRVVRTGEANQGWRGHAWEQFILPGRVGAGEVLWSPANSGPLSVANQVLTLHDLSPLEHPEWFRPDYARWYGLFLPLLARRVKRIIVPSDYVRRKALARFSLAEERVVTIPEGVDGQKFHPSKAPKKPYVLFVGTLEPRKNLAGLLEAWKMLQERHKDHALVLAGGRGQVFSAQALDGKLERVRFSGRITEAELPGLYAGAELFIQPSHDEGFGLTVLEAMACGTAVITARSGALPEVTGEAGLYFDPAKPAEIAATMERCLDDPALRADMREKGLERAARFSWTESAERIWQVLQR